MPQCLGVKVTPSSADGPPLRRCTAKAAPGGVYCRHCQGRAAIVDALRQVLRPGWERVVTTAWHVHRRR